MLDSINIHYIYTFVQCLSNKDRKDQYFCAKKQAIEEARHYLSVWDLSFLSQSF